MCTYIYLIYGVYRYIYVMYVYIHVYVYISMCILFLKTVILYFPWKLKHLRIRIPCSKKTKQNKKKKYTMFFAEVLDILIYKISICKLETILLGGHLCVLNVK